MSGVVVKQSEIAEFGNDDRTERFRTTLGGATGAPVDGVRAGWYRLAAGASNPRDVHAVDEMYFITEGAASIELDGESHRMTAGDTVLVPAGCHHQIQNDGDADLILVFLFSPPPMPSGGPSQYSRID